MSFRAGRAVGKNKPETSRKEGRKMAGAEQQMLWAKRAYKLLWSDMGVTHAYATAAIEMGMVDVDELRGHKTKRGLRWFLA
jgi:hypothetical protein